MWCQTFIAMLDLKHRSRRIFFFYSATGINLRLKGGIKTPATPFMMRRKYSPLPVMRHKYPAKLWFWASTNGPLLHASGCEDTEIVPSSDGGEDGTGEAVIEFPQRGGGNEVAEMAGAASCKERGGDRCDASSSQAVTTWARSSPLHRVVPAGRSEVSGPREMCSIQQRRCQRRQVKALSGCAWSFFCLSF